MGVFTWLKELFFRKEQPKIASSEIIGYDTSLVYIPKYKDLSEEERKQVDKYIKQTNISKLEDIITYGSEMSKYSSRLLDLLLNVHYKMTEENERLNLSSEEILKLRIDTLVSNEQINIYNNMLHDLEKEVALRTVALEQIYKEWKNSSRKVSLFDKAERLKKHQEKNQFEYAIERMKISKKVIEEQIQIAMNTYNSNRCFNISN